MTSQAPFWNNIAEKYAAKPVPDARVHQHKLEVTRSYFTSSSKVLEIGSGTGASAVGHAPHVAHILATDLSERMIEIGWRRAEEAGVENIVFEQASIEALKARPASFDVILAFSRLHLLADRPTVMQKVRRLLKPGGYFITNTACIGDRVAVMKLLAPIGGALGVWPSFKVLNEDKLIEEREAAGFTTEYRSRPEGAMASFLVPRAPLEHEEAE